jgi:hypothetical protein
VEKEEGGWAVGLKWEREKEFKEVFLFFFKAFLFKPFQLFKLLTLSKSSKHF